MEWMNYMFHNCRSLISLNLSNFNTKNVLEMVYMFKGCSSLKYLDVSNFDTSKITGMTSMLDGCTELISLNLSNFNTQKVGNIDQMFRGCESLKILDISNFNTSLIQKMNNLFENCSSLESLDLSSFDTSHVSNMEKMFLNCKKLEYIYLFDYKVNNALSLTEIFTNVNETLAIYINSKIKTKIPAIICERIDCSKNCGETAINIIEATGECLINLLCNSTEYKYEYKNKCYYSCPNGTYSNKSNTCEDISTFTTETMFTTIIIPTTQIITTYNEIISTSKEIIASTNQLETTEITKMNPTTTPILSTNEIFSSIAAKPTTQIITKTTVLPNELNPSTTIIQGTNDLFNCSYLLLLQNLCSFLSLNNTEIFKNIIVEIIYSYPSFDGENIVIKGPNKSVFQITTSKNEKDSIIGEKENYYNLLMIDLKDCEYLLKKENNINENISLIILKFENLINLSSQKSVNYEVYDPISKKRFNLTICQNTSIDLHLPVQLSEKTKMLYNDLKNNGYDLFNLDDEFYKDICTPYTSENNTDVVLSTREEYYFNNIQEIKCQSNCHYSKYNSENELLKCECGIVDEVIEPENTDKFKPKVLYQSFYDVLKYSNYKIIKCYKLVFDFESILKNYGSIISMIYFLIYSCFLLTFLIKGINQLKIDLLKKIAEKKKPLNNRNINEKLEYPFIINVNNNNLKSRNSKKSRKSKNHVHPPRKKHKKNKIKLLKKIENATKKKMMKKYRV